MEMYQHDGAGAFRFVLSGDLSGMAVQQLEWAWETAKSIIGARELIVDISGVANADPVGLELLFRMRKAGASLTADLRPASPELLGQFGVRALEPRRGVLARIWHRWSAAGVQFGRTTNKSEVT